MKTSSKTIWPNNAPFALFLSHDVDQIHDRELFHFLATLNHIRRMLTQGEPGNVILALKRLARSVFAPKPPLLDFETILAIEGKHGFRSTFFILHDVCASKNGPRYRLDDPVLRRIVDRVRGEECGGRRNHETHEIHEKIWGAEIGLHGGVKCLNDAAKYRQCREEVEAALNVEIVGIRNHLLKHDGPVTWQAQQLAGFAYDATFGHAHALGPRDGQFFPFNASEDEGETADCRPQTNCQLPTANRQQPTANHPPPTANCQPPTANRLLALPLTVMDCTLFRSMKLTGEAALEAAWQAITPVIEAGGLVSLLWHNNFFNEPEYADWQWVYERLLERLAELRPWCATGAEIAAWWSARSA